MRREIAQVDQIQRIALGLDPDSHCVVGGGAGDNIQIDACRKYAAALMIGVISAQLGAPRRAEQRHFIRARKGTAVSVNYLEQAVSIIINFIRFAVICAADCTVMHAGSQLKLCLIHFNQVDSPHFHSFTQ